MKNGVEFLNNRNSTPIGLIRRYRLLARPLGICRWLPVVRGVVRASTCGEIRFGEDGQSVENVWVS